MHRTASHHAHGPLGRRPLALQHRALQHRALQHRALQHPRRRRRLAPLVIALTLLAAGGLAPALAGPVAARHTVGGHRVGGHTVGGHVLARQAAAARHVAAAGLDARPIASADLNRIVGGTCTTCSNSGGGGGGGTGSSGAPTQTGTPYWETYRVSLDSIYETPASLVNKIDNYSSVTINGTYQYTRMVVRDVQFSGGYASFVRASIGGEVSEATTTAVTYPIPPRTYGKLYVKYRTERRTYYGRQYQDFNDGSRVTVDADSGPYLSTSTVLGYVTGAL